MVERLRSDSCIISMTIKSQNVITNDLITISNFINTVLSGIEDERYSEINFKNINAVKRCLASC